MRFVVLPLHHHLKICLFMFSALLCANTVIGADDAADYAAVQEIFEQKCIACHACYDAPCQLNMQGPEGVQRGASKLPVYNGTRLKNAQPTRLHEDAQSIEGWRKLGFFPVINDPQGQTGSQSSNLMQMLVEQGHKNPLPANQSLPKQFEIGIKRQHACPTPDDIAGYLEERPLQGMPYGVSGLSKQEYALLTDWFAAGSPVSKSGKADAMRETYQEKIEKWENFLNRPQKKYKLLGRYLYEHLFLGHLYLSEEGAGRGEFFKLVRSRTSGDEEVQVIATRRPNEDPKGAVYYRLVPITDTIVFKNHITYPLTEQKYNRLKQLFFAEDWQVDKLPGYDFAAQSNPFTTFAPIPAKARYQFMLDNAEYFTRNFIRGPVCHGPVATAVIRDHFWTFFEDPKHELYVNDKAYRETVSPLLGLPGQKTDILSLGPEWLRYQKSRNEYLKNRHQQYQQAFEAGAGIPHVWDGEGENPNAHLTIFRHHDSAGVSIGLHGQTPRTMWVMDYPLLERGYYELVVSFDVFGSVSHQAQTRLYFDLIRNGAEQNFLRFIPMPQREKLYENWYRESGKFKILLSYIELDTKSPSAIQFESKNLLEEFGTHLKKRQPALVKAGATLNTCQSDSCNEAMRSSVRTSLLSLTQKRAKELEGVLWMPNLSLVQVDLPEDQTMAFSLVRNRAHSNVAFILGEDLRLIPEEDSLSVVEYLAGSYPNFMFRVNWREVPAFTEAIATMKSEKDRTIVINRWGIRRTHPDFWKVFHGFKEQLASVDKKEAGVLDMNRYLGW